MTGRGDVISVEQPHGDEDPGAAEAATAQLVLLGLLALILFAFGALALVAAVVAAALVVWAADGATVKGLATARERRRRNG